SSPRKRDPGAQTGFVHVALDSRLRGMSGLIAKKPAAPSLGLTPREFAMEDRACASAGADLHAERRRHVRLLAGGAVATGDGGALDAVFLERIADRDRAGRAVDLRTARRQQVGGVDDVLLGDVDQEIAVHVRIRDVVEADFL